jgi:phosphomannomutase
MNGNDGVSALLGQMASLANFMYVDGRAAFAVLPSKTQSELRIVFEALNEELQTLLAETGHA